MIDHLRTFRDRWNKFWFEPDTTVTVDVIRIAFGLLVIAWTISLSRDAQAFFSGEGSVVGTIDPEHSVRTIRVFLWEGGPQFVLGLLLVAAICLTVGFWSRIASVAVFLCVLALQRRNPDVMNAGDKLLMLISFFLMFAPLGTSLSLDRWRKDRAHFWDFPERSLWAVRLIQVQITLLYLFAVFEKVQGPTWVRGTAVPYTLGMENLVRFRVPEAVLDWLPLMNLLTWATIAIELSVAILVWNARLRPWVLALGAALHVSIDLAFTIGFFSFAMLVSYLSFVPSETMMRRVSQARRWIEGRRGLIART